jgi:hypothetical protein
MLPSFKFSKSLVSFLILFLFLLFNAQAQGGLMIMPKRLVFEGSKRTQTLNLVNMSNDSATYAISFIQIKMKEDGTFKEITEQEEGLNFASKYLRFFPRTVKLGPKESQTVRVQLNRINEIVPGEYRSHMFFRAVPTIKPLEVSETKNEEGVSIQLRPIFGISIPTIITIGDVKSDIKFLSASIKKDEKNNLLLNMSVSRKGNMSVYGDISIDYISPQGKTTRVGALNGIAIYSPTPIRNIVVPLENSSNINLNTGKLRLVYTDQSAKPLTLAEYELILN